MLITVLMITIFTDNCNPISQILYNNILYNLQFHQLSCSCGQSACLSIHGYYTRGIKIEDSLVPLRICRVKCSVCNRTHALLLSSIVPYSQISLQEQVDIISCYESNGDFSPVLNTHPSIDESNLRYVTRQYLFHWLQRLLSMSISISSKNLIPSCFSSFGRQFMQIKRTVNILFLRPT